MHYVFSIPKTNDRTNTTQYARAPIGLTIKMHYAFVQAALSECLRPNMYSGKIINVRPAEYLLSSDSLVGGTRRLRS